MSYSSRTGSKGWKRSFSHQDPTFAEVLGSEDGGPYRDDYPDPPKPELWIYFAVNHEDGTVKVGSAKNVERRLKQLQRQYGVALDLLGVIDGDRHTEYVLHSRFQSYRVPGSREWYSAEILPDLIPILTNP